MDFRPSSATHQSYAQWVQWAIRLARGNQRSAISFFDSSVPEPKELLRQTVARAFHPEMTSDYVSAFGGGNPIVIGMLAEQYGVAPDQVLCTTGASGALSLLYRALAVRGERVLVETPGFDLFEDLAVSQGLHVDHFKRNGPHFSFDPYEVEQLIKPDTRLIVLSNLHNPSGMPLDYGVLQSLIEIAARRNAVVIVDEVYGDYAHAEARPCPASSLSPNVVSVSSLTKIFGLSTLRCGWIVGAQPILQRVRNVAAKLEFGVSTLTHAVAANVLRDSANFTAYTNGVVRAARPRVESWFAEQKQAGMLAGDLPEDGCICFPRLVGVADTEAFSAWLLERSGVIVAPGEYFGAPGHIRIGFAQTIADLDQGLEALDDGMRVYRDTKATMIGSGREG